MTAPRVKSYPYVIVFPEDPCCLICAVSIFRRIIPRFGLSQNHFNSVQLSAMLFFFSGLGVKLIPPASAKLLHLDSRLRPHAGHAASDPHRLDATSIQMCVILYIFLEKKKKRSTQNKDYQHYILLFRYISDVFLRAKKEEISKRCKSVCAKSCQM